MIDFRKDIYQFICRPGFYLTFWQLSTYDLAPPTSKYDEEGTKLRSLSRQEDSKYVSADRSSDRSKRLTAAAHRTRRDRYNTFINILSTEFKDQTTSRAFTIKRLLREKQHWFAHCMLHLLYRKAYIDLLVQHPSLPLSSIQSLSTVYNLDVSYLRWMQISAPNLLRSCISKAPLGSIPLDAITGFVLLFYCHRLVLTSL